LTGTAYDEVAYPSRAFRQTHPQQLAVAAVLLDAPYAPMAQARVLEIGCGEAGNIIPLALSYPEARIVGFDLAASAIAAGQRTVERLGLTNIRLEALDILQATPASLGEFDYIIAHGVYSWVPGVVRDAMMALIGACLAPAGLAIVSYNALPGCHIRQLVREMVLHHLAGREGFEARVSAAREILTLLTATAVEGNHTAQAVKAQCENMLARDPRILFHDELGEVFDPLYLRQFMAEAGRHGLQYVADAESLWWREELFPTARGQAVRRITGDDPVEFQQYLDFLSSRYFRQTILARRELRLDRKVDHARVRRLWAAIPARPETPEARLDDRSTVRFDLGGDAAIALDDPALKQALVRLGQVFPHAIAVAEFPDTPDLNEALLQLYTAGHLDLATGPPPMAAKPGPRPVASALARLQATDGHVDLTGLDHNTVRIEDAMARTFLTLLDGERTREALVAELATLGQQTQVAEVEAHLQQLARLGLLVA
jgi:hypothetical protein